jgi:hypothetical protein
MSDSNAVKIDIGLGGLFDFCLPDNAEGDSLSGNEIHAYKADGDDGASEVFCPVSDFCRKLSENRLNTTPAVSTSGRLFEKRAKATAHRTEQIGNWRLEYDASNKLIRAREIEC